jgi:hypothetical protein
LWLLKPNVSFHIELGQGEKYILKILNFNSPLHMIMGHILCINSVFSVCPLRPDLMDNYLALVLSAFIKSGLLEVWSSMSEDQ